MKTILITGGCGFMGSNLVGYLHRHYPDYRLVALDSLTYAGNIDNLPKEMRRDDRFVFWYGSVKNSQLVDTLVGEADVVIHMAAESHVARSIFDNFTCFDTNVMGTQVVANAVLRHHQRVERFIHVSTSEVYGSGKRLPMSESHPLDALTPYAASKLGAERLVYSYFATYDIPAVILRPFNNCGPRQHLEKVIPRFVTGALLGEDVTVHGNGSNTRDWVYVDDFCRAVEKAMHVPIDRLRGQVINIGTGRETSVLEVARQVIRIVPGTKSAITHVADRPGQVERHRAATDRAEELLGWTATTPFEEALARTAEWYRANREWWQPMLWMRSIPIISSGGRRESY